jgi:hypothetical protein
MASIHKEIQIQRSPDQVWAAIRDVGAVHERLARGFVVDTCLEPGARVVTFANGVTARELIVAVDEDRRRIAYSVAAGPLGSTHHNASFEVTPEPDGGSRLVWITDVLPDEVAPIVEGMVEQGSVAIARTLME